MTADERLLIADELPPGWVRTTLGEVCQVNPRMSWPESFTERTPVSFVPMAAVDNVTGAIVAAKSRPISEVWRGYKRFAEGDVIFARITPCMENGKAAIATDLLNGIGLGSTEFHVLRPTEAVSERWVYHFVRRQSFRNEAARVMTGTAGQLRVPKSFMEKAPIPLPPWVEQRRIVAKIESLFAQSRRGREALATVPDLLAKFRQAVLAAAFRGDLTQRDPADEPASILLERIRAERRRQWEENLRAQGKDPSRRKYKEPELPDTSELPELPEGWRWTSVNEVAKSIQYGYTSKSSPDFEGPRYLRITDIQHGFVNWSSVPNCEIEEKALSKYLLKPGDIVFARSGATAGKSYLIMDCPIAVFASYLIRVQLFPQVSPEYLYAFFGSKNYWDQVITRGNAQPNANARVLGAIRFPLAPLAEQRRIVARIEALFAQAGILEAQVAATRHRLEQVDQAILARAFRGELVEQYPEDEPASALLERIQREHEIQEAGKRTRKGQKERRRRAQTA